MKVKCAHAFKANKSEENREKTNELLGVGGPDITSPVTSFGCLEDFKLSDNKLFLRPPRQGFFTYFCIHAVGSHSKNFTYQ